MIEGDRIRLSRGPKESHARPSVDVLFRSFPSMPRSALDHVAIDYELRIGEMPGALRKLTREALDLPRESLMSDQKLALETGIALHEDALPHDVRELGKPSFYTCPECHGSMVTIAEGAVRRYRCHTGHGFTQGALSQEGMTQIENTLWSALAQIEEQKMLQLELADQARVAGSPELERQYRRRAAQIDAFAKETRNLALDPMLGGAQV